MNRVAAMAKPGVIILRVKPQGGHGTVSKSSPMMWSNITLRQLELTLNFMVIESTKVDSFLAGKSN